MSVDVHQCEAVVGVVGGRLGPLGGAFAIPAHSQTGYLPFGPVPRGVMADETRSCHCVSAFDTLEELTQHAGEKHPGVGRR